MTKLIAATLLLLALTGCTKSPEDQPQVSLLFSRTVAFANPSRTAKAQAYNDTAQMQATLHFEDGKLHLFLNAPARTNGSTGEAVAFFLDAASLSQSILKEYSFTGNGPRILSTRYTHTNRTASGGFETRITDTGMGTAFGGSLTLTGFNPIRRTVNGRFRITVNDLPKDPTLHQPLGPIDPAEKCNLTLEAEFKNIRVM